MENAQTGYGTPGPDSFGSSLEVQNRGIFKGRLSHASCLDTLVQVLRIYSHFAYTGHAFAGSRAVVGGFQLFNFRFGRAVMTRSGCLSVPGPGLLGPVLLRKTRVSEDPGPGGHGPVLLETAAERAPWVPRVLE